MRIYRTVHIKTWVLVIHLFWFSCFYNFFEIFWFSLNIYTLIVLWKHGSLISILLIQYNIVLFTSQAILFWQNLIIAVAVCLWRQGRQCRPRKSWPTQNANFQLLLISNLRNWIFTLIVFVLHICQCRQSKHNLLLKVTDMFHQWNYN